MNILSCIREVRKRPFVVGSDKLKGCADKCKQLLDVYSTTKSFKGITKSN